MKVKIFTVDNVEFKIESDTEEVVIYDLIATQLSPDHTPVIVGHGKCLKEACDDWLASNYDISNEQLVESINAWRQNEGLDILAEDEDLLFEIDKFINSKEGIELFCILNDGRFYFVDWSKIECGT